MGVCYEIICRKCKRSVDLGKSPDAVDAWSGTVIQPEVHSDGGKHAIAFMRRHWGHDCVLVSDHDDGNEYGNQEAEDVERPPAQT